MLHVPERPIGALTTAALNRLTLAVNHVLASEPQAVERLKPHAGKTLDARAVLPALVPAWLLPASVVEQPMRWRVTPAGLLERLPCAWESPRDATTDAVGAEQAADASTASESADVVLRLRTESVTHLVQALAKGDASMLDAQGDPALSQEILWIAAHVRWDFAGDIERVLPASVGAPVARAAERLVDGVGRGVHALEAWWSRAPGAR